MWCVFNSYNMRVSRICIRIQTLEWNETRNERKRDTHTASEADANLHGMCLMLFISSFELPVYAVCSKCCVLFSVWERSKANEEAKEKKNNDKEERKAKRRNRESEERRKKNIARDKSNRNVENNTQCYELCAFWEAKIESTFRYKMYTHTHRTQQLNTSESTRGEWEKMYTAKQNQTMPCNATLCQSNCANKSFLLLSTDCFCSVYLYYLLHFSWMRTDDVCPLCFTIICAIFPLSTFSIPSIFCI